MWIINHLLIVFFVAVVLFLTGSVHVHKCIFNFLVFFFPSAGYTIQYPAFQRPLRTNMQPMHTDIRHFEQHAGFENVRNTILRWVIATGDFFFFNIKSAFSSLQTFSRLDVHKNFGYFLSYSRLVSQWHAWCSEAFATASFSHWKGW
jgi:hypothetical protein